LKSALTPVIIYENDPIRTHDDEVYDMSNLNENYISIEDAGLFLNVKPVTLRKWIKDKNVPAHKIGKQWKFKRSELEEWVKSGKSAME